MGVVGSHRSQYILYLLVAGAFYDSVDEYLLETVASIRRVYHYHIEGCAFVPVEVPVRSQIAFPFAVGYQQGESDKLVLGVECAYEEIEVQRLNEFLPGKRREHRLVGHRLVDNFL